MLKFIKTYKENFYLMLGHFATDICQGSISAALTVMFTQGVITSKVDVSLLVLASCLFSSIVQPIIGFISDRKPRPYLMWLGMIIAALGLMLASCAREFYLLFIFISCSGIGVAIFHPQGGKMANCVSSSNKKGLGMSIFSVGGNLGFAAGPALISLGTYLFGLPGIAIVGTPAVIMLIVFTMRNKIYQQYANTEIQAIKKGNNSDEESILGFTILTFMIFSRACVLFGLTTFIPLYFMEQFHINAQEANLNLTVIAFCAALASIISGILADKIGFKKVLAYSSTMAIPFMFSFCLITNNQILATILLIPVSLSIYGTLSISMVLGQKFLCRHVGFASGVTIGLGMTFGGLFSPILGHIADHYGLSQTMWTIACLTILTCIFSWLVPDIDKIRAQKKLTQENNSKISNKL